MKPPFAMDGRPSVAGNCSRCPGAPEREDETQTLSFRCAYLASLANYADLFNSGGRPRRFRRLFEKISDHAVFGPKNLQHSNSQKINSYSIMEIVTVESFNI